jgi:hypothetical protein
MCGYVQNDTSTPGYKKLVNELGLANLYDQLVPTGGGISRFYPAFGGDSRKKIRGLIIAPEYRADVVDTTWWFDCQEVGHELVVGKRTTYNARKLE